LIFPKLVHLSGAVYLLNIRSCILALTKITCSNVLGIIRVSMTVRRDQSVSGIVAERAYTVIQHITVKVVTYRVAVEHNQSVVSIVTEAAVGRVGNVTRCIVAISLLRKNNIDQILDRSLSDSVKIIISITHLSRICNRKRKLHT